jgi:peptidyl-prolyl cis-trans isomerase C
LKNKTNKPYLIFWVIFAAIFGTSCEKEKVVSKSELSPNIIATVNGEVVDVESFKKDLRLTSRKYRVEDSKDHSEKEILFLKLKTLNEIIQNTLFKQEAKKYKVSLDPDEFQATMEIIKTDYLDDSFKKTFKIQSISQLEWEDKLKNSLILKNLINEQVNSKVRVGEDASKKYFEEHPEEFQKGEQVKALHINVATEEEARRLLKKIKSRKAKFTDMAVKHSLGPESVEGGNLGYFEARQMPAEFDGVFDLKLYGTSDVIQTPYGYHIFKVVDKKPARKMSYDESKKIIRENLLRKKQEKAFKDWVVDLKNKAIIKINYEAIENVE